MTTDRNFLAYFNFARSMSVGDILRDLIRNLDHGKRFSSMPSLGMASLVHGLSVMAGSPADDEILIGIDSASDPKRTTVPVWADATLQAINADPYGMFQAAINRDSGKIGTSAVVVDPQLAESALAEWCEKIADILGHDVMALGGKLVHADNSRPLNHKGSFRMVSSTAGPLVTVNELGLAYGCVRLAMSPSYAPELVGPYPMAPNGSESLLGLKCEGGSFFHDSYAGELDSHKQTAFHAANNVRNMGLNNLAYAIETPNMEAWRARSTTKTFPRASDFIDKNDIVE